MLLALWSPKGGSGTSVVAAALALVSAARGETRKGGRRRHHEVTGPHDGEPDDHGEAATVDVGDHPRRDLRMRDRQLERGAGKDELEASVLTIPWLAAGVLSLAVLPCRAASCS